MVKILILIGGSDRHIKHFAQVGEKLGCQVKTASFSRLNYLTLDKEFILKVDDIDIADFDVVYIRLVGKHFEEAALVSQYAYEKNIPLVDRIFTKKGLTRLPIPKSIEAKLLFQAGLSIPRTFFGSLKQIEKEAPGLFGFPFVIKGTTGRQGRSVWSPRNGKELEKLLIELRRLKKRKSKRVRGSFIAQEFICVSQRHRLFVLGGRVVGAITRPTRWRKRFLGKDAPEGKREALFIIPKEEKEMALQATSALGVDIAGVDLIRDDKTGKLFVLEVNSAPRWESIRKDCHLNIEEEIIKFLIKRAKKNN